MCHFVRKCWAGHRLLKIKIMMSIAGTETAPLTIKEPCGMVPVTPLA